MTTFHLDTSVAVHALYGLPSAEAWFDSMAASPVHTLVSSRILRTERCHPHPHNLVTGCTGGCRAGRIDGD